MKHCAIPFFAVFALYLFVQTIKAQTTHFEKLDNGVIIYFSNHEHNSARAVQLEAVTDKIIHVIKSPELPLQADTSLMILKNNIKTKFSIVNTRDNITLSTCLIKAIVSLKTGLISFTGLNGNKLLKEDNNVIFFKPVSIDAGRSWEVQQSFITNAGEAFYGLGQHQQGLMNYKDNVVTLLQNNTEVAIPFLVSNKNYGILWDNYSITKFSDGRDYESLSHLKLFDANGNSGAFSANYILKNDSSKIITKRKEDSIAYDYLPDLKNFPDSFPLNKGMVIWNGFIQSPYSGLHKFSFRYGGYIKAWLND